MCFQPCWCVEGLVILLFTSGKFRPNNHDGKNFGARDSWLDYTPIATLKDYMKVKYFKTKDNYDLIEEVDIFEQLQVDDD